MIIGSSGYDIKIVIERVGPKLIMVNTTVTGIKKMYWIVVKR